jgi:hypothetical protein
VLGLLRARGERPRRRNAEEGDELASPDVIFHPILPAKACPVKKERYHASTWQSATGFI